MADNQPLLFSSRKQYFATVAIDIGTTSSCFAYSFNTISDSNDAIFMNKDWGIQHGCRTPKTPTCLLLKPDKSFDSFGYEAMKRYANEIPQHHYYYFERFKMKLHSHKELNRETMLQASNGKSLRALDVFAQSIRYLKDEAIKLIREMTDDDSYTSKDIQWVLTVPAIWSPAAKQFMREAAYEADVTTGDNPEQLMIAPEPEAASLFCFAFDRENRYQSSATYTLAEPGTHYMVAHIGEGTLNVIVYEVELGGSVKEVHHVIGGPYGGRKVDEEFSGIVTLLKDLLRKPKLSRVTLLLLVGGFADSALLQAEVKKEFSRKYRVMVPQDASMAVVQGAVIYGNQPHKITAYTAYTDMSVTCGADCSRKIVPGVHLESKKFYDDEGVAKCSNLFNSFVTEDRTIKKTRS